VPTRGAAGTRRWRQPRTTARSGRASSHHESGTVEVRVPDSEPGSAQQAVPELAHSPDFRPRLGTPNRHGPSDARPARGSAPRPRGCTGCGRSPRQDVCRRSGRDHAALSEEHEILAQAAARFRSCVATTIVTPRAVFNPRRQRRDLDLVAGVQRGGRSSSSISRLSVPARWQSRPAVSRRRSACRTSICETRSPCLRATASRRHVVPAPRVERAEVR